MFGFINIFLAAGLFYVNEPVVNMREFPTIESKVVSQTVFAENVTVENEQDNWAYIRTPEKYGGWVPSNVLIERNDPYETTLKVSRLSAHLYGVKDTEYGPIKTVPYGTKFQLVEDNDPRWLRIALPDGKECYVQRGDVKEEPQLKNKGDLVEFSKKFLNLPYTWGGRSSFGYDCSGFVQMLYSQMGFNLPRDSKQQVLDSRFKDVAYEDLEPGDLIFFGKARDKISHVGMYIGNGEFIHSTVREYQPWIRICKLTDTEWTGSAETTLPFRLFRQLQ